MRIGFLWHQHQPHYKIGDSFLLPWVRLHATKDYYDVIAGALERFPQIRQTVNLAPTLIDQLADYTHNGCSDAVLKLSAPEAASLTAHQKRGILQSFFLCNVPRMIDPYPRYAELYGYINRNPADAAAVAAAVQQMNVQDWLDLQVWYNLTWIGPYSACGDPFARLLRKGAGFTEADKTELLTAGMQLMADVIPSYRRLSDAGQIELSVTPYYHPILPLLCDISSALESLPDATLPAAPIQWPEDARWHVGQALDCFQRTFGQAPQGMWPAEGAVSTQALDLIAGAGLRWVATDEGILRRTLGGEYNDLDKYFPYTLNTACGPLRVIFRDNRLSDDIGFVYSSWPAQDAAQDFVNKLLHIRERIIRERGPEALDDALVPVILDGENCWEYYQDNGRPFLEALYSLLSDSPYLHTVTISQALAETARAPHRTLQHIHAGSWINADFAIWMGHHEDITAWEQIAAARTVLTGAAGTITPEQFSQAMGHIYAAQGSDWFWWYGTEHNSPNDADFDALFRWHLLKVYQITGLNPPAILTRPIKALRPGPSGTESATMHRAVTDT